MTGFASRLAEMLRSFGLLPNIGEIERETDLLLFLFLVEFLTDVARTESGFYELVSCWFMLVSPSAKI